MSTRSIFIAILLLIAASAMLFVLFGGSSSIRNYPPKDGPIISFGDSLISGVGATSGNDLSSILSRRTGREIINMGVSGNTTTDGLARINQALALEPSIVIVLLGGNDYLRRVPQADTFANLNQIINRFQESGAVVLLLGVRGGVLSDQYEKSYRELAEATGSAYVPDVLRGLIGNNTYMSDAVHPNDVGYARMAERVYPALRDLLE